MAIPKFFHNSESVDLFQEGAVILLSEEETRHAGMARRLQVGSEACLLDGKGYIAYGNFVELTKRVGRIQIDKVEKHQKPNTHIRVAAAIPKGDRQKVMLDMLTQSGVTEFIPLNCEFSSTQASPKQIEKWNKIIIEACKQSGNPFLMKIHQTLDIDQLLETEIWQNSDAYRAEQIAVSANISLDNDRLALIGPEGGFSDEEMQKMDNAGAKLINLGQYILRTETAAVAAVSILNS